MDYPRGILSKDAERSQLFKVYDSLNELVDGTLCEGTVNEFHKLDCLHIVALGNLSYSQKKALQQICLGLSSGRNSII